MKRKLVKRMLGVVLAGMMMAATVAGCGGAASGGGSTSGGAGSSEAGGSAAGDDSSKDANSNDANSNDANSNDANSGDASGDAASINATTATYDEMVAYLTDQGFIEGGAQPVDINATEGYIQDNTGGQMPTAELADKACDYNGLWLFWWDLANDSQYKDRYEGMKNNAGTIVVAGGAASLQTAGNNGNFAVAFSEDYAKKDEALKAFKALPKE